MNVTTDLKSPSLLLRGFEVLLNSYPVWQLKYPFVDVQHSYHYEGRIAVNAGDQLGFFTYDAGWVFEATGYVFDVSSGVQRLGVD